MDAFQEKHFRSTMIGVHLRRGDFVTVRPGIVDSTKNAMAAVDDYLNQHPDAGVLLCTDDGAVWPSKKIAQRHGVVEAFTAKYGDRLARYVPRSLDRTESVAVEDALVELLLLRRTNMFVGTQGSGFSDFVMYRRSVPYTTLHSGAELHSARSLLQRIGRWILRRVSAR